VGRPKFDSSHLEHIPIKEPPKYLSHRWWGLTIKPHRLCERLLEAQDISLVSLDKPIGKLHPLLMLRALPLVGKGSLGVVFLCLGCSSKHLHYDRGEELEFLGVAGDFVDI